MDTNLEGRASPPSWKGKRSKDDQPSFFDALAKHRQAQRHADLRAVSCDADPQRAARSSRSCSRYDQPNSLKSRARQASCAGISRCGRRSCETTGPHTPESTQPGFFRMPAHQGWIFSAFGFDLSKSYDKTLYANITLARILRRFDVPANERGETRSGCIAKMVAEHSANAVKRAGKRKSPASSQDKSGTPRSGKNSCPRSFEKQGSRHGGLGNKNAARFGSGAGRPQNEPRVSGNQRAARRDQKRRAAF